MLENLLKAGCVIGLVAFVVAINVYARRLDRERKRRGEPEPDLEIEIW